ncbi:hypothetical protein MLD38_000568 [Melastoma candidum]|uniref:Uncharacterized protein n=1 Tax=Melastoma candidum TaxID=119954 RepID=A0ACB9SBE1_9MYRT|nr:hypothetical protein MLD38_000568 [Melastoma candidum]
MQLQIEGTLSASTDTSSLNVDYWISFRYIDDLIITGNGVLNGQGNSAWKYSDCLLNPRCITLPTTLRLDFVNNAWIHNITSVDSKNTHLSIFACQNVTVEHIKLTAPDESPNTDGIKIALSSDIYIRDSDIGTGDDCIALLSGSERIIINNVACGPGHGISIGSLGGNPDEKPVTSVWVGNCTFIGTTNGVRIKTKASSYEGLILNITYADIHVDNVANPILIEQQYCPSKKCDPKDVSLVAIRNVTYRNITGTSNSQVAVNLQCSPVVPCLDIELRDIDLSYNGPNGDTTSSCANVVGLSFGKQHPPSCVNHQSDNFDSIWH